jgi:hypothetical protein
MDETMIFTSEELLVLFNAADAGIKYYDRLIYAARSDEKLKQSLTEKQRVLMGLQRESMQLDAASRSEKVAACDRSRGANLRFASRFPAASRVEKRGSGFP